MISLTDLDLLSPSSIRQSVLLHLITKEANRFALSLCLFDYMNGCLPNLWLFQKCNKKGKRGDLAAMRYLFNLYLLLNMFAKGQGQRFDQTLNLKYYSFFVSFFFFYSLSRIIAFKVYIYQLIDSLEIKPITWHCYRHALVFELQILKMVTV